MATPLQQQPPAILSAPLNMQTLGNMVRHWVHFDTQAAQFNKEASASRASKDFYEQQILAALKTAQYETAVIQIAGGRILVNEERHNQSLTFKSLEEMLHEYYRQKPGTFNDETAAVLKFIKGHRQTEMVKKLKKVMNPAAPRAKVDEQ